jgi:UDP-4-amino-4,6-dideoxy-N-acetyl-beta-L-altrosamine N-acetyltransferase
MSSPQDITLVELARERLPLTLAWRNRPDIARCFFSGAVNPEQHAQWFNNYERDSSDHTFIIQWRGRPVGMAAVYHIDPGQRRAEFGRLVIGDQEARGRGVARAACAQLAARAFAEFEVDTLFLEVFADNAPAIRLYEALGFMRTGTDERPRAGGAPEEIAIMELHKSHFHEAGGA